MSLDTSKLRDLPKSTFNTLEGGQKKSSVSNKIVDFVLSILDSLWHSITSRLNSNKNLKNKEVSQLSTSEAKKTSAIYEQGKLKGKEQEQLPDNLFDFPSSSFNHIRRIERERLERLESSERIKKRHLETKERLHSWEGLLKKDKDLLEAGKIMLEKKYIPFGSHAKAVVEYFGLKGGTSNLQLNSCVAKFLDNPELYHYMLREAYSKASHNTESFSISNMFNSSINTTRL